MIMMSQLIKDYQTVMEPVTFPKAFDDENYIYQVKWDGVRMIAVVHESRVRLINKHGHERTNQYGELQELPAMLDAKTAVLDGELVVLKEGKPSFPSIMRRDSSRDAKSLSYLRELLPVHYMVFDLLHLNGQDLRQENLLARKSRLEKILFSQGFLHLVEDFDSGRALFKAVDEFNMEGIVAKAKESLYLPGKKHRQWLKIKCLRSQNCLVGGYTLRGNVVNALLLGVYKDGGLSYVGKAGSGLSHGQQQILSEQLPGLEISCSPFINLDKLKTDCFFIKPEIGVRVEYLEWSEDMKLRSPTIKEFIRLKLQDCQV